MIAYEFYLWDIKTGYKLLGILPERRKKSERITRESVMGWVGKMFSNLNLKDISFIEVTVSEYTGKVFRPISAFREPSMC